MSCLLFSGALLPLLRGRRHGCSQIPNMYNKTYVDILIAHMYNDAYTKTDIDSTLSAYTNSIDLHKVGRGHARRALDGDGNVRPRTEPTEL